MFQRLTLEEFLASVTSGKTSVLFIKEHGCRYCEIAEDEMKNDAFIKVLREAEFFEANIDDQPELPSKLGLVGVPAFFKINGSGRKQILTGFQGIEALTHFVLAKDRQET